METAPWIDGAALRAARIRAGLTQHELAHEVGVVGGERVSMWERGEARPRSPQLLHAVARALGVPVAALLVAPDGGPGLRWLRFSAGLSVEELAHAVHLSAASLKRWEAQGRRRLPSSATLDSIALALGVDTAEVKNALRR
ncbi:helix-turn-helix domain-containing protein [Pengzhenrongella frigida]|uniref:XRE family transcriptional regulator n=1 Tax=Pengzhenrongella frigida TaxID=1259133 RepID=A0A4Q5N1G5_9MICO|nr:helix-turn-helix transcriptional regulator [Cellulomonas sp. HLT2-17]RYV51905.1 XRE family transcriptional regulator [Cellulomonas sp. HLT2-17]